MGVDGVMMIGLGDPMGFYGLLWAASGLLLF